MLIVTFCLTAPVSMPRSATVARRRFRCLSAAAEIGLRQEHGEFIAPQPAEDVDIAQEVSAPHGNRHQYLVAGGMAVGIVDLFKLVDIEHEQREGMAVPARPLDFPLPLIEKTPVVGDAGEVIGRGQPLDSTWTFFRSISNRSLLSITKPKFQATPNKMEIRNVAACMMLGAYKSCGPGSSAVTTARVNRKTLYSPKRLPVKR